MPGQLSQEKTEMEDTNKESKTLALAHGDQSPEGKEVT